MFATGETVGLAEWIIDDTCLVSNLFCFARYCKVVTDLWTDVQTTHVKIVITTGLDCGSASWINNTR